MNCNNPANYISFNNELWQIIGVESVTDTNDNTEAHLKIIKAESIGDFSWDSSPADVNAGKGVNDWSESDLAKLLNNDYLYSKDMGNKCYVDVDNFYDVCPNWNEIGIKDDARNMLEEIQWNVGKLDEELVPCCDELTLYDYEMIEIASLAENTWSGYIGLEVPSDFIYSSGNSSCINPDGTEYRQFTCEYNNWNLKNDWTIIASMNDNNSVFYNNYAYAFWARESSYCNPVHPVAYLKSNIKIVDGKGTEDSPFILEM